MTLLSTVAFVAMLALPAAIAIRSIRRDRYFKSLPRPAANASALTERTDHDRWKVTPAEYKFFDEHRPPESRKPMTRDDDLLLQAAELLARQDDNPFFDAITWCPEQHVLSFRRAGGWQWVTLWLHNQDVDSHEAETNNGPGGTNRQTLWVDGEKRGTEFVWNIPLRRTQGFGHPVPEEMQDRAEWLDELPPVY